MKQLKKFVLTENELCLLIYALGVASGVLRNHPELRETSELVWALTKKITAQTSSLIAADEPPEAATSAAR